MKNKLASIYSYFLLLIGVILICGCSKAPLPEWMKPQIVTGIDFLEKNIFVEDARIGTVTDIKRGELDPSLGLEIGIAGNNGALFIDDNGKTKTYVDFKRKKDDWSLNFEIVDIEKDGICEFLRISNAAVTYDALLDHKGDEIWTTGSDDDSPDDTTSGDLDGDGNLEFVSGWIWGINLIDRNGKEIWRKSDVLVWQVKIADTNQDGKPEIVHRNGEGILTIRDKDGNILSRSKPLGVGYLNEFAIVKYPTSNAREYLLIRGSDKVRWRDYDIDKEYLLDFDGKTVIAELIYPNCGSPKAIPVQLSNNHPPYLAIFGLYLYQGRKLFGLEAVHSALYVLDSEQNLVYYEVIDDEGEGITVIPSDKPGEEILLIGGTGKVWQYKIKNGYNEKNR